MEDRLDRIEAILDSFGGSMADLKTKQEMSQRQLDSLIVVTERLATASGLLIESNTQLTQIVTMLASRQQDQENRIDRLEQ